MSEPIELLATAELAAIYERYAPYLTRLGHLYPVFEAMNRVGIGQTPLGGGQYVIYALIDPDSGQIAYIGMTRNPEQRALRHREIDPSNPAKTMWMQGLRARGLLPPMRILEAVQGKTQALEREARWIEACERAGIRLLNQQSLPRHTGTEGRR